MLKTLLISGRAPSKIRGVFSSLYFNGDIIMLLQMKNITKRFGKVIANDDVSINMEEGEILAVIGENGAGKTTIMKALYGLVHPEEGEILINDKRVDMHSPQVAISHGIGMVQQHFMLFENYSVAENIVYSKEPEKGMFFDRNKAREIVLELSKKYGLEIDPDLKVYECSVGMKQRVEILKVLYQNAHIIIFDEPTAVLVPQEVDELLKTLKNLRDLGKSVIIITHKLNEVMEVADRAVILRKGKFIDEKKIDDTSVEELAFAMVGRELPPTFVEPKEPGAKVLEIENLIYKGEGVDILKDIDIHVRKGEVVGIAGVSGNGQSELIKCITGIRRASSGTIKLNGENISKASVKEIRDKGCAHIPEDRFIYGCAKEASLVETSIMGYYGEDGFSKNGILNTKHNRSFTHKILDKYGVKFGHISDRAASLSGGNLQKLIVAREIEHGSDFLIAAEPTRGVDIGAMEYIHERIIEKRNAGGGVLLISSELSEIMKLSDRIYVIYDGEIKGEFTRGEWDRERIGYLMMGGK